MRRKRRRRRRRRSSSSGARQAAFVLCGILRALAIATIVAASVIMMCSLYGVHDDTKDKPMEVELSWLSEETGWRHVKVPDDKLAAAVSWAKAKIEEEERGSDSDEDDDDDDDE